MRVPRDPMEIRQGLMACADYKNCTDCPYDCEEEGCMRALNADALALIRQLEGQNAEQAARLEQVTRERDALKADILRATDKAKEMQSMLDDDVHPNCDYGLYLDLCDALGDVVDWEHGELLGEEAEHDTGDMR